MKTYYEREAEFSNMDERMRSNYYGRERYNKIMEILGQLKYDSFLDVGCGNGVYLVNGGVGIDLSNGYLRQALIRMRAKRLAFNLIQADATKLPFPSNIFDFVLCSEVLEHVPDWRVALNELTRVARKYILISVPGHTIFSVFQKDKSKSFNDYGKGHLHDITPMLITNSLKNKHLISIEDIQVLTHVPPQIGFLRFLDKPLRLIFRKRGLNQIVLLRKKKYTNRFVN